MTVEYQGHCQNLRAHPAGGVLVRAAATPYARVLRRQDTMDERRARFLIIHCKMTNMAKRADCDVAGRAEVCRVIASENELSGDHQTRWFV
jgi:hypothetical protein